MENTDILSEMQIRWLREKYPKDAEYSAAIVRVQAGEPFAYVVGETVFYDETYTVTPDVLIPRPDTERVLEKCLQYLHKAEGCTRMLDLCTGSGCIAISCAAHSPHTICDAADISAAAIAAAVGNSERNGASSRVNFVCADIFAVGAAEAITGGSKYDVIVSNPPYISSSAVDTLDTSVRCYEPRIALDGGVDGLYFYRGILEQYLRYLKPGGVMVFEIGYNQAEDIKKLAADCGQTAEIFRDWGGNNRIAVIKSK